MAKITHPATFNNVAFGQYGCVYHSTSSDDPIKPPTGKVFVAIQMLQDTAFDEDGGLVSEQPTVYANTQDAAGDLADGSETAAEGSGGVQIPQAQVFPKGLTIYGRWTEVDVNSGAVIAYIGL